MSEKKCFCQSCGQSVMKHKHTLSRSLVIILLKASTRGSSTFHLQKDLNLTKNEYANFQKLRYWDLVTKDPERQGFWSITAMGRQFMAGAYRPAKSVWTFNNRVVGMEGTVSIFDLNLEPVHYKQREDYIDDALPVFEGAQSKLFA